MIKKIGHILILGYNFFIRKRALYRLTGIAAIGFIFYELGAPNLPLNSKPDYNKIAQEYGEFAKTATGFFVDKIASGTDYTNLSIAVALLSVCLLIEFKILKTKKAVNATNVFSGWFQKNTINYYNDNE
jgi:hypothetical protein